MTRFAVVAPPLPGHLNPLLVLARELTRRGHEVTFIHMADAAAQVEGRGAAFLAVGRESHPPGALAAYLRRLAHPGGPLGFMAMLRATAALTDMLCRDLPGALETMGAEAVICDQAEAAGVLVARHLGLPVISTATALLLNREPGVPPPFVPWPYDATAQGLTRNRGGYWVTDLLLTPMRRVLVRHGAAFGLDPFADQGFSPLLTVAQMPRGLDFPRTALPPSVHYGGPWRDGAEPNGVRADVPAAGLQGPGFQGREARSSGAPSCAPKSWAPIAGEGPLVFCSLGTLQGGRFQLFRKVALAAQRCGARLVVAHGGGLSDAEAARLAALGPGIAVHAFVPQREVLAQCAAAVLHCGMNTVLDALAAGVPLVACPIAFEQPATAARLAYAGAARVVPLAYANTPRLADALGAVLADPTFATAAQRLAGEMVSAGGVGAAADRIEAVVG